jgi:hypothetical protein
MKNAIFGLVFSLSLLLAGIASADEVGTVAGVSGSAEIGRGGVWTPAEVGSAVQQGDELRTSSGGQLRVVFQDDSVLNLGSDSHAKVDEQVFDPSKSPARSVIQLLQGRVRALVSEYYRESGAEYEIQTGTAVAGVRGTEFVVTYDERAALTEVVGITGKVEVHSLLDRASHGVFVTAGEVTNVRKGQFPTQPPRLEEDAFHQVIEGLDFIGTGRAGGLTAEHPIVGGVEVPDPDRAPKAGLEVSQGGGTRDASSLLGQPPGVIQALTGDLRIRF